MIFNEHFTRTIVRDFFKRTSVKLGLKPKPPTLNIQPLLNPQNLNRKALKP